jgi:hypothetical protein
MEIRELRNQLELTLSSLLGEYRFLNGATTPAIAARPWGAGLPPQTTVTGLECLIIKDPEPIPIVRQYKEEVAFQRWTVFLVDWDGAGERALEDAAGRIIWAFPGSEAQRVSVPRNVGPLNQMQIEITTAPHIATETTGNFITTLSGLNITTLAGDPLITL